MDQRSHSYLSVGGDEDCNECGVYIQLKDAAVAECGVDDKRDLFVEHLNRLNVVRRPEQVESTVVAVDDDDDAAAVACDVY